MSSATALLGLHKADPPENVNVQQDINDNYDVIDATFGLLLGTVLSPITIIKRKIAQTSISNDASVNADPHLSAAVIANAVYDCHLRALYESSVTADFQMDFTVPTGAEIQSLTFVSGGTTGGTELQHGGTTSTTGVIVGIAGGGAGVSLALDVWFTLVTAGNPGNLTWRWAQQAAEVSNTIVKSGGVLRLDRMV